MKNRLHLLAGVFCITVMCVALRPVTTSAQDPAAEAPTVPGEVVSIGAEAITSQNVAKAKEGALARAMSAAVEQAGVRLFGVEAVQERFPDFVAVVREDPAHFISQFKVLAEHQLGDHYLVMLGVTVSADALKQKLGMFQVPNAEEGGGNPRVLFLLSEQLLGQISPLFWWGKSAAETDIWSEKAMGEEMVRKGFVLVDHGWETPDVPIVGAIIFQPDLSDADAVDVGKHMGADIVVAGKAIVYKVMDQEGVAVPAFNATVTARALSTAGGNEISAVLETAVHTGADEEAASIAAIEKAAALAGRKLAADVIRTWDTVINPANELTLLVRGARNLGNFIRFRQTVSAIRVVKDIQIARLAGDEARVVLRYYGDEEDLRRIISEKRFELFTLEIGAPTPEGVPVALVPKPE